MKYSMFSKVKDEIRYRTSLCQQKGKKLERNIDFSELIGIGKMWLGLHKETQGGWMGIITRESCFTASVAELKRQTCHSTADLVHAESEL